VLGGGFIGLELAATARQMGKDVHVIEGAARLISRAVSPEISDWLLHVHRASGIDVELSTPVDELRMSEAGHLTGLIRHGVELPLDLLLLGIGAVPETSLAEAAGLACRNGIVVDEMLCTEDPSIHAIGDCASFPYRGTHLRLESVQNANDQAKCLAAVLTGRPSAYGTVFGGVPWFWSEQGSVRLQMVGLAPADAVRVRRPGKTDADFSILHYVDDRLVSAEMINSAPDYMAVRKLLEKGGSIPADLASDPAVSLRSFL
jgi:3-phenylpropionate/trans-cinnamate dioxygenase ferredoxin reductase subunit